MESKTTPQNPLLRTLRLGREIWITAARNALVTGGITSVKIKHLAKALNVNRGNFYHHFKNRNQLLDELLQHWMVNNTLAYEEAIEKGDHNRVAELAFINTLWLGEKTFDPKYDLAIRDWGRTSDAVTRAVRDSDKRRIHVLETIFHDLGYEDESALVRAQVAYFHQIGRLMLELDESAKTHQTHAPAFLEMLLGK